MYRVVTMYGIDEPWWFFDDWKNDIISVDEFEDFYKALKFYKNEWLKMAKSFEEYKSQEDLLSAFWEEKDQVWCEECAGYLQRYHSLALLEEWHQLPREKKRWAYEKKSGQVPHKCCKRLNQDEE
ncbi:DUF1033 family protein [Lactococcus nasutitermitis]|uniref:DUF1033 family protein n=1 Tax=Lactococcus nasutitermitis TaxID=1652957 RepID=A0ABV9JBF9_9LACT|nr:DUF1033 family protein [Lactococcus nasutitermitis]